MKLFVVLLDSEDKESLTNVNEEAIAKCLKDNLLSSTFGSEIIVKEMQGEKGVRLYNNNESYLCGYNFSGYY